MRFTIAVALLLSVAAARQLNDDIALDELNLRSNLRSKRALCGSQPVTPKPIPFDPDCLGCSCFVTSKRAVSDSLSGLIGPNFPTFPRCDYTKCCSGRPWLSGSSSTVNKASAAASLSDSSIKGMASDLINTFGKRAAGDEKFKKPSIDLVFLIDDSGSIPAAQFTVAKEGAATLSQALCPRTFGSGKGQKQVSVVLFSTTPQTIISFEDSRKGAGYVEDAILGMKQRSGTTATVDALTYVRKNIVQGPGSRLNNTDTATVVFVITDGKCNQGGCSYLLRTESTLLRALGPGVQIFAFGVGEADCDELETIRGTDAGQVFGLPNFDFFEKLAIAVKEQMANNDKACVSDE